MAKISTYVIDGTIVDGDKVIGSDANNDMITKNYTVGDLVNYFAASIGNNYLVPYFGANDDVDLGSFNLSANSIFIGDLVYLGGSAGNPGEVLTSQGTGSPAIWSTIVGSQDLFSVLNFGNTGNKSITLDNAFGTISLDIDNIYDFANVTVIDKVNSNTSRFLGNELVLQDSALQKDVSYFTDSIVYRDLSTADTVTVKPAAYNNQTFLYPYIGGALVVSVNGVYADMSGNVTIPFSGVTGSGTTTYIPKWSSSTALSDSSIFDNGSAVGIGYLAGAGTRMVVADASGILSTQAIPSGGGGLLHGTASGTDTYTTTISGVTSYADADAYLIRFTNGNTTGCTLNINGLGARTLYRNNDGALIGGDIISGAEMLCIYNSTLNGFQVIGTAPNTLLGYVTNDDSVTITKGQVVYAFGGQGDRMTVKLANNTGDATSARTVGVVLSTSIAPNQKGLIMMQGLLDGLSILPTATWNDGDPVYLGATAGSITNVKPYAPNHLVYVGTVTTASNGSAGRMYVNIQNGYELDELHNVQAQSPTYKDTLWYDNTVSPAQWKTASISTILGYTPLSTIGSGTTNYLAKWNGTNSLTGSVIYDTGTNVIIGSSTDAGYKLDVVNGNTRLGTTTSNTLTIGNGMLFDYSSSRSRIYSNNSIIFTSALTTGSKIITGVIGGNSNTTGSVEFESALGDISQTSGTYIDLSLTGRLLHTSGTSTYNFVNVSPTLQTSVGGTYTGTVRGFYYNPTTVNVFGGTQIAFENTTGDIVHGNLSGVGTRMVVADSTGKLGVQAIPGGGGSPAGSDGYIQFNTSGAFNADADLFWDNTNKRLGIGTTTPSGLVQATGTAGSVFYGQRATSSTGSANCTLGKSRGTVASPTIVQVDDATGGFVFEGYDGSAFLGTANITGIIDSTPSLGVIPQSLRFTTGTTLANRAERMRITSGGFVGIGTTTPLSIFHSVSTASSPAAADSPDNIFSDRYTGSNGGTFNAIILRKARGTSASPSAVQSNDGIGVLGFRGYGATGFSSGSKAFLAGVASENWTDAAQGTHMTFWTTQNGTTTAAERLRISNDGNVGIGTISPQAKLFISDGSTINANLLGGATTQLQTANNGFNGFRIISSENTGAANGYAGFTGLRSRGTLTSPTTPLANDFITGVISNAYDGSSAGGGTAAIFFKAEQNVALGVAPQRITFETSTTDNNSRTEKMAIKANGNVLINTTTDSGYKLDVVGSVRFQNSTLTLSGNAFSGNKFVIGNNSTYKNGAATNTPLTIAIGNGSAAGVYGYAFDAANTLGFLLTAGNGTTHTARASMNIANLVNTAGAESGDLTFSTQSGGAALAERMRIFAAGNVGIGTTTNAGYKLDINGTSRVVTSLETPIVRGNTTSGGSLTLSSTSNATKGNIFFGSNAFVDEVNNTLKIGNVLPPTDNAAFKIQVTQEASNATYVATCFSNTLAEGPNFNFAKYKGTAASPLAVASDDRLGQFTFLGYDGSARQASAGFLSVVDGAVSSGVLPARLEFQTGTSGAGRVTQMTIKSDGKVGIGTTTPTSMLHNVSTSSSPTTFDAPENLTLDRYVANSAAAAPTAILRKARGTSASPSAIQSGDVIGVFGFRGHDGTSFSSGSRAFLSSYAAENWTSTNQGTYFVFGTTANGTTSGTERLRITDGGGFIMNSTNTAAGTTGNQTINKPSGTVNIAAAGTTITVTNSLVTTSSIVFAVIRTNDTTAVIKNVVPAAGSFTINLNAAATAETSIGFFVIN